MGPLTRGNLRQSSHQRFVVADSESVGAVRRTVGGYAERFSEDATFVAAGVEIIAVDRGPGIRDVAAELRHDRAVVAAALHRDHSGDRDDATVVVLHNLAAR